MGNKRDRRVTTGSDRHRNSGGDNTPPENHTSPAAPLRPKYQSLILFLIIIVVVPAISLTVYHIRYSTITNPNLPYVYQQGLIKTDLHPQQILTENSKVSENISHRHFTNPVLAYITPWNSKGYDLAKVFNSKFTHLSPVWYDLKSQGTKLILEGRHNADISWISELRMKGNALLLPRIVLEASPEGLLGKKKQRAKAIDLIVAECKEMEYDGIVLESWSRWAAYGVLHDPDMRNMALQFVKQLGETLHRVSLKRNSSQHLQLVYVIGPPHAKELQEHDFGPQDLLRLNDSVDGFSLMTYDYSSPRNPGPNAPLKWIRSTLQILLGTPGHGARSLSHKIFLGLNFYGNDFTFVQGSGGGAITGREYLSLLEKHNPVMQWDSKNGEHYFFYADEQRVKHAVHYPSLMSISLRLHEAQSWGAGVSIWEIGQGLDYFFDLL